MRARSSCLHEIVLAAIDDDEVRPQRQNALDVGVEQRADAGKRCDLGRLLVVAADGDDAWPGADGKQNLGRAGTSEMMRAGRDLRVDENNQQ